MALNHTAAAKRKAKMPMKLSVRPRLLFSALAAATTSFLIPSWVHLATRILCIWDAGMFCFLALSWIGMLKATPESMSRNAKFQDDGRVVILSLILTAACASILAIGFILQDSKGLSPALLFFHIVLSILTIIGSWLLVHTIFASHYAKDYYQDDPSTPEIDDIGGLEFPNCTQPDYWDFLYFSFVIGMTSQVSDVQILSRQLRRLALFHSVLSFFFNTAIVAMSINIIAGLIGGK
jgi:uncharacterized membrane protein